MIFISTILLFSYTVFTAVRALEPVGSLSRYFDEENTLQLSCRHPNTDLIQWTSTTGDEYVNPTNLTDGDYTVSTIDVSYVDLKKRMMKFACHVNTEKFTFSVIIFKAISNPVVISKENFGGEVLVSIFSSYVINRTVRWFRNNDQITKESAGYTLSPNDTLMVHNFRYHMLGDYQIQILNQDGTTFNATYSIDSVPIRHAKRGLSKNLVQDEVLLLNCDVNGLPMPVISWKKNDELLTGKDPRVTFKEYNNSAKNIYLVNGSIRIENIDFDDRANYSCVAENIHGVETITVLVRIKDKLAALWPFLGICAEVVVLCCIILFYEKMRAKKMHKEDMQEEANIIATHNSVNKNDEVRQRK